MTRRQGAKTIASFTLSLVTLSLFLASSALASDFTVHPDQPVGPPIVGFGAEMNPYLFCTPNNIDAASAADYEKKVVALAPQHVRIFCRVAWFDGEHDGVSKDDPKLPESFLKSCEIAQKAGATINVTFWYGPWTNPEAQMKRAAELINGWITERHLTAIKYVTIQNEVNDEERMPPEKYTLLYRTFDAELKRLNARDKIKIVSGDLVSNHQEFWFPHIAKTIGDISDGYSIHAYWDYWDTEKPLVRLNGPRAIVDALPKEQQRPLFITEFGVRGHRLERKIEPGTFEDGVPVADKPLQANQLARFMLEGLNRGYVAFVIWTMEDAWYDRLMPYGLMGTSQEHWRLKPSYHLIRLLTHTTSPGSRAVKIEGQKPDCVVAATRDDKGDFTVYALNLSTKVQDVTIAGVNAKRPLAQIGWNHDTWGSLTPGPQVNATGQVMLRLPPLAMTALTPKLLDQP